jgi:hypothetical protein
MAAGKITKAVTYATGVTVPLEFQTDNTASPTLVHPINMVNDSAGNEILGKTDDAAAATGGHMGALRAIATALGITALDLGTGTGGTRTLRFFKDTAQWIGGSGANGTAVQRVTIATDDTIIASLATKLDALNTDLTGGLTFSGTVGAAKFATGTQSSVAGSATDVTILAANSGRGYALMYNESTAVLTLLFANATSSTTVKSIDVRPYDTVSTPDNYTGVVKGFWASATGSARVTEFT